MRAWLGLAVVACAAAAASVAHAQGAKQGQDTAPKPQPSRVHLGATSVTVVDEHETVDDIITRLRKAKPPTDKQAQSKSASATQTTTAPSDKPADKDGKAHEDGRAELRSHRALEAERADGDRPKEERRERSAAGRVRGDRRQRR
jgi:hypothetical protein